ncbi:hypothetical protein [Streptomyces zagrosensis]|uniref:Uncharacterized protein n=1 Tax=Streptomyces zagrosensis TaxID=1042984 RepID=A0A7W9UYU9_9ACTN|nr:hypothetical protein [Streptomyces zagrosensis]MBB5935731.1 hypothetical protein [Streptomyces zagrosensis]
MPTSGAADLPASRRPSMAATTPAMNAAAMRLPIRVPSWSRKRRMRCQWVRRARVDTAQWLSDTGSWRPAAALSELVTDATFGRAPG